MKISIGPAIENGFYYDFEFPEDVSISEPDFPAIEAEDGRAREGGGDVRARGRRGAKGTRAVRGTSSQDYKIELIDDLVKAAPAGQPLESVSLYTNGPFTDLCRGPHAP